MSIEFKFDKQALERAMKDAANQGLTNLGAELQQVIDYVGGSAEGKSVEAVREELRTATRAHDFNLPEEHLTAYAEQLSRGGRVVVQTEPLT